MNCKMKPPQYPKTDGGGWEKSLPSENTHLSHHGTFAPFFCEVEDEDKVVIIQKH